MWLLLQNVKGLTFLGHSKVPNMISSTAGATTAWWSAAKASSVAFPAAVEGQTDACWLCYKGKGSQYSIAEHRVLELILVLGSQLASEVSDKPSGRLPLLSARPAVTHATLKRAATNFAAW